MIKTLYDKFKHWSDGGNVWLIGDTHFNDADCKLMDQDWPTPKEQVKKINHLVKKLDTLVILGDVGDPKYVKNLDGRHKILIMGNHDSGKSNYTNYFDEIYEGPVFIAEKILLSHEPVYLPFCLNIHGHDHNGTEDYKDNCKHLNLAANVCGYEPKSLAQIIKDGGISRIDSIHRITIDGATERKNKRADMAALKETALKKLEASGYFTEEYQRKAKENEQKLLEGIDEFPENERAAEIIRRVHKQKEEYVPDENTLTPDEMVALFSDVIF